MKEAEEKPEMTEEEIRLKAEKELRLLRRIRIGSQVATWIFYVTLPFWVGILWRYSKWLFDAGYDLFR